MGMAGGRYIRGLCDARYVYHNPRRLRSHHLALAAGTAEWTLIGL